MALADFFVTVLTFIVVYGIFALGLNLKYGFSGLVDFGHVIYFMIGAYVTTVVSSPREMGEYVGLGGFDLPGVMGAIVPFGEFVGWMIAVVVAMVAAGVVGMLIGLLTVRLREDYLAITTLGMAVILQAVVNNERWLFNGSFGIRQIHRPLNGSFPLSLGSYAVNFAVFGLASLVTIGFGYYWIYRYVEDLRRRDVLAVTGAAVGVVLTVLGLVGGWPWSALAVVGLAATGWFGTALLRSETGWSLESFALFGVELTTLWYFVVPVVLAGPDQLFFNLFWLFDPTATSAGGLDYGRFFLLFAVVLLVGAYYLVQATVVSPFGRVLVAIREDEDVTEALGKPTFVFKVKGFVLGSVVASLAGSLWAVTVGFIDPTQFGPIITFFAFAAVIIGGTANHKGVILGTAIFWLIHTGTRFLDDYIAVQAAPQLAALRIIVIGVVLIVILYYRPEGILGEQHRELRTHDGE